MTHQQIKEEVRKKFGQFYVSVDDKTNAIRIVDLEGGIAVNEDDGTKIRCIASTDIENYILSLLTKEREELVEKIEGMKKPSLTKPVRKGVIGTMSINWEYNQALTDLLNFINKKK